VVQEKAGKIKDIKETVSGAVELLHQFRTPEVQESFGKITDAVLVAKEIIKDLKTPEMVKNIENFRLILENMNQASERMQNTIKQLEDTGVITEAKGLFKSAKNTMDSFGENSQELPQMSTAIKEMINSVRDLVDELKITVIDSKNSGAVHSIKETIRDASEIYKTTVGYKGKNRLVQ
jgi:muramoyltetrapeptide carboxypeptidase LdcA involved in peptidoglycan recycling